MFLPTPPGFGGKALQHFLGGMAAGQLLVSATANRVEDRNVETCAKYSSYVLHGTGVLDQPAQLSLRGSGEGVCRECTKPAV